MKDADNGCNIMLDTRRKVFNGVNLIHVELSQVFETDKDTEKDMILPKPEENDMMFFILEKKTPKEKFMFMCHLGEKKVNIHFYALSILLTGFYDYWLN